MDAKDLQGEHARSGRDALVRQAVRRQRAGRRRMVVHMHGGQQVRDGMQHPPDRRNAAKARIVGFFDRCRKSTGNTDSLWTTLWKRLAKPRLCWRLANGRQFGIGQMGYGKSSMLSVTCGAAQRFRAAPA